MTSMMNDQQKILFEEYQNTLKDKVHRHDQLKQIFYNLANSLSEMSSDELKNISKNRYQHLFKQINPVLKSKDPEVKAECVRNVLHNKCKPQFEIFAVCQFQRQAAKEKASQMANCQRQVGEYFSCLEGTSNTIVMSALNIY